jgi:hypothetical protein
MQVDPANRLVADELEGEWNEKLTAHKEALEAFAAHQGTQTSMLGPEARTRLLALAKDFPRLWNDPRVPHRERKRMVRLLLEDVTLIKGPEITAQVRFKGGTTQSLTVPSPPPIAGLHKNPANLVVEVDRLLDDYTHNQIVTILSHKGLRTVNGRPPTRWSIRNIQIAYGLSSRYDRLRKRGMLTMEEVGERLHVAPATIKNWNQAGLLMSHPYNDKNQCLFEPPGEDAPVKNKHKGFIASLAKARLTRKTTPEHHHEVQYGV